MSREDGWTMLFPEENLKQAALDEINNVRKALGFAPVKKLQPGLRGRMNLCPVSNTIRGRRKGIEVRTDADGHVLVKKSPYGGRYDFQLSGAARNFIEAFDAGSYPELAKDQYRWVQ